MSIIIFSRPIHSGKTTELLQWCGLQENIQGILMPDIDGNRKILNIKTGEVFDIQCANAGNTKERLTTIGRYSFYTAAFEKANLILLDAVAQKPGWLVIDEAGKLELDGKGFHDAIKEAVAVYNNRKEKGSLLITVRDSLYEEVIDLFKLKDHKLIRQMKELL